VSSPSEAGTGEQRWLLLIHQIPPKPDYLRVKIGRRLQRVGAVAIKNSVYALPDGEQSLEDLQWIRTEIVEGGGDASICRADFVDGLSDEQIRETFQRARGQEYSETARAARELLEAERARGPTAGPLPSASVEQELARLAKRFATTRAIDFFDAPERRAAQDALDALEARVRPVLAETAGMARAGRVPSEYRNRTWVTRAGVYVDRIASAWLIRTFIDPDARFEFVAAEADGAGYRVKAGELRFDMFEAEFTHEGDRCTFETLLRRFALDGDPALVAVAEIVHDIDVKDGKYERAEAPGVERLLSGIARGTPSDAERVERGGALFAALYAASGP
jgi:hypothetical protein